MGKEKHKSAKSSHYDADAEHYDAFNEKKSQKKNKVIEGLLKKHNVHSVLDLSCGTGSQTYYLHERGYSVIGVDINKKMLQVAKSKSNEYHGNISFKLGDMRTTKLGKFDAVITIFNAIGHLTKRDYEKSLRNIHSNLKNGGIYIFDIFNLQDLLHGDNITRLTIDWPRISGKTKIREIQYSTISEEGVLASHTTIHQTDEKGIKKIIRSSQTIQVYSVSELKELLSRNGFKIIEKFDVLGAKFHKNKTEHMLLVAKKSNY
jgi:ubiquinone/menaquinone biosynthesis C-methylase UbiE